MRLSVWCSVLGTPDSPFTLPYDAQSPSLSKVLKFESEEDVLQEIERLIDEAEQNGHPVARSLYLQCPLFADIRTFIHKWHIDMVNDYWAVKTLNIPLATSLDKISVSTLDSMMIIEQELNDIQKYRTQIARQKNEQ